MEEFSLYFNPRCSKCRTAQGLLADHGVDVHIVDYLKTAPTLAELRTLMEQLDIRDPRAMMRTSEPVYASLGLADAEGDVLLAAIVAHPILLERPIVVHRERAVIARPPEKVFEFVTR